MFQQRDFFDVGAEEEEEALARLQNVCLENRAIYSVLGTRCWDFAI